MSVYVGKKAGTVRKNWRNSSAKSSFLAEGVDVSKMTISRIENGENAMSILLFFQIVSFLDISEEEVIRLFRNCDKECREAQGWR